MKGCDEVGIEFSYDATSKVAIDGAFPCELLIMDLVVVFEGRFEGGQYRV